VENKTASPAARPSPSATAPANTGLNPGAKIALLRTMVRIRRFEERSLRAYQAKKIGGFLHLYIGQEAVAVGCCSLMGPDDHVITAYRDHGHAIAVGMELNPLMAELYGKATGCSKGKGGSMHFFDPARHYWGGHGIVGGQVPLGAGLAYGIKYQGLKGAAMTFMGDGAVNQGAVHEAYNLAALWQLPVVFVIENNGYSMGTSQARSSAGELAKRAARAARVTGLAAIGLVGALVLWVATASRPAAIGMMGGALPLAFAIAAVIALVAATTATARGHSGWSFVATGTAIIVLMGAVFARMFPDVLPASNYAKNALTIAGAASQHNTLNVMTIVAAIFTPFVLAYQSWTYWVFRQRLVRPRQVLEPPELSGDGPTDLVTEH